MVGLHDNASLNCSLYHKVAYKISFAWCQSAGSLLLSQKNGFTSACLKIARTG